MPETDPTAPHPQPDPPVSENTAPNDDPAYEALAPTEPMAGAERPAPVPADRQLTPADEPIAIPSEVPSAPAPDAPTEQPLEAEEEATPDPEEADLPVITSDDPDVVRAKERTRESAKDLRVLVTTYVQRHLPETPPSEPRVPEPPKQTSSIAKWLPFMRVIPYALWLLFGASFLWDFPGRQVTFFGYTLVLEGLLRIIAVSGLIGFMTNWLAVTMLFNPREKRPIFGQGLIPAQRERVIYRLAKAISEELINAEIIKQKIEESQVIPRYRAMALDVARGVLEDDDFRTDLKGLTAHYVDSVLGSEEVRAKIVAFTIQKLEANLGSSLGGLALKAYRFVNEQDFKDRLDKIIRELPTSLDTALDQMDHLLDRIPEKLEARSADIEAWATRVILGFVERIDVYSMIMSNMEQYDEAQLENLLKRTSNEQFNYIKYLGGILGALGGLVIWQPLLALAALGSTIAVLWGLDEVLHRAQGR